jgi:N-acetylmuramic acid 6-phosphate etherase
MVQGIIAGGDIALKNSVEGAEDSIENGANVIIDKVINRNDVVLGISANGDAPFIWSALEEAKKRGAITGLLMCNIPIKKDYIDYVISVIVGPEVITGSTRMKAGTATKFVLNMITTTAMIKLNKTYGNLMVDLTACNDKLWDRGARIISQITDLNYDDSLQLLKEADGEVKTAIVMDENNCSKSEAKDKLDSMNGSLSEVLDN